MKNKFSKGRGAAMLMVIALILGGLAYYASIITLEYLPESVRI